MTCRVQFVLYRMYYLETQHIISEKQDAARDMKGAVCFLQHVLC